MPLDPEVRESLARIYELLRQNQVSIQEMYVKTQALEMAMRTNQSFVPILEAALAHIQTPILLRAQALALESLDALIHTLREPSDPKPNESRRYNSPPSLSEWYSLIAKSRTRLKKPLFGWKVLPSSV